MSPWEGLRERIAGKWQIPLLLLSLAMLAGALWRIRPDPTTLSLPDALKHLDTYLGADMEDRVLVTGRLLLAREDLTDGQRAPIHLRMARAAHRLARRNRSHTAENGHRIAGHYEQAAAHGLAFTAEDQERFGDAMTWQGKYARALARYEAAIEQGVDGASDVRHDMYSLRRRIGADSESQNQFLDTFLASLEDHRLDLRIWAIERKVEVLEELGSLDEAATLLVRQADAFRDSDYAESLAYLKAFLTYKEGHYDEAERSLRAILNRVSQEDHVHAAAGWLLGRTVLDDGGPQRPYEAISFFTDVIALHPGNPYAVASRVDLARALALLERHREAVETFQIAIEESAEGESEALGRLVNRDVLRVTLGVLTQSQRDRGDLRAAVDYAQLAEGLVDDGDPEALAGVLLQLGQVQRDLAEELSTEFDPDTPSVRHETAPLRGDPSPEARLHFLDAAEAFLRVARVETLNERRAADSLWRAAELFTRGGRLDRAANIYQAFVAERPTHALVSRAMLRIGQLYQAIGAIPRAIEAFQACNRRYPRTLDGARALIPLARSYLAQGPESEELAEKTLRLVLEDSELFTPQAPEFADALFLIGEVHNRRGEFELAVGRLEEALDRYPDDPRSWRTRALLADSYRQSGLALKREASDVASAAEVDHMRAESARRFERARELYRALITEYTSRPPGALDALDKLYLRHAYVYEADCYFEVGDYAEALERYEESAGLYKDTTTALSAYVQVINCHVFLGKPKEARAALARARIVARAIPGAAFDTSVSPETREDWQRYFDWLGDAELF